MKKKRIILVSLIISVSFLCNNVYALSLQELLTKQNQIDQQKNSMEKKIDKIEDQKNTVEDQIGNINEKISQVQSSLISINNKLVDNQLKINSLNKDLEAANKKAQEQQNILQSRLKAYYKNGDITYLDIIFGSASLTELISRVNIVKRVVGYDKDIFDEAQKIAKEIEEKKVQLQNAKAEIDQAKRLYEDTKQQQVAAKEQKKGLMARLTQEQRKIEKEYEELEEQSYKITQQIQSAQGKTKSTPYSGGAMAWPSPNYYTVTSPFGMRFHPILKVNKMHTGIDINTPLGATIVAASDGKVINSSYISGYGNTVIIDHGGGISTLYGHNSSLIVSNGQNVKKGQTIAKAGSTGNSTGPHCHFEVRVNGVPANPMSYLK